MKNLVGSLYGNFSQNALWGAANQVVVSLTNFGISALLVIYASKEQFGLYGIAFSVCLFVVGLFNALVSTQLTVNSAGFSTHVQLRQAAGMLLYLSLLIAVVGLIGIVVIVATMDTSFNVSMVWAIVIGIVGFGYQEFFRRFYYLREQQKSAFLLDLCISMILVGSLLAAIRSDSTSLETDAIVLRGFAVTATLPVVLYTSGMPLLGAVRDVVLLIRSTIANGSWALAGSMITNLQGQSIVYLVGFTLGSAAVGEMNAARLLISPLSVISTGLNRVFFPKISALINQDQFAQAMRLARSVLVLLIVVAIIFGLGILVSHNWIEETLLNGSYTLMSGLTVMWMFYFLASSLRTYPSTIYQASKHFAQLTTIGAKMAVVGIVLVFVGVTFLGMIGGIAGMAMAELLLFFRLAHDEPFLTKRA